MKELFSISLTISFVCGVVFVLTQRLTRRGDRILGLSHGFAVRTMCASLASCIGVILVVNALRGGLAAQLPEFVLGMLYLVAAVSIAVIPTLLIAELVVLFELWVQPKYREPRLVRSHLVAVTSCLVWAGLMVRG